MFYFSRRQSQWPRGLRRRSTAVRQLRLWVRILQAAWLSVCCECCVLSGRGLCDSLITRTEESYRLWCVVVCDLETSRMRQPWPALSRSVTEKKKNFSRWQSFQTCYGVHPASYPTDVGGSFPGSKPAQVWSWHSPPSTTKINNEWRQTSAALYAFTGWTTTNFPFNLPEL